MQFASNSDFYKEVSLNGFRIRGYFINEVIVVERLMDRFIAKHFTPDTAKQIELIELFISTKRISFEGKRQAFKFIVDHHYATLFENKDLIYTNLKKIEDFRNILAHNILDTRPESAEDIKNGTIGFLKFENDTTLITYTQTDIDNFVKMIADLQKLLYDAV